MKISYIKHLAAAVLFASAVTTATAEPIKVTVAAEPAPPLASKNAAGAWEGFEVDLAKAVCKAAKVDCTIVATAWDGIIPALTSKKVDVIWASMTITPERSQQISFTIPYYNSPAEFVGNKDDRFNFSSAGLKGKSVGVEANTTFANYLTRAYPSTTIKTYSTLDAATADLAAGRLDLVIADAVALDEFLRGEGGKCCEGKNFPKDSVLDAGMGGGIRKEDTSLKAQFDAGIRSIYANGEFDKIEKKYFKYDVGTPPK